MRQSPIPDDEEERLTLLRSLKLLDTSPDASLDRLTELACEIFDVPIALISLVDQDRQWFKARQGISLRELPRDISFCGHAVALDAPLIVEDAMQHDDFADNPLVEGAPYIRFYAGHPLRPLEGQPIGTLCLIDTRPRAFDERARRLMSHLAMQADDLLQLHLARQTYLQEHQQYHRTNTLLRVLHQGITDYQALMAGDRLWQFLMQALRELTQSEYALIGEVIEKQDAPALKIHAITDLSWSEESRQLMERLRSGDMQLTNSNSLLGVVFAKGTTIITDDLGNHPLRGGFPPGHPTLHNYMGVPIHDGDRVIGMYAIANSRRGYSQQTLEWLEPFTATCALLINLYRQFAERETVMREFATARDQAEQANRAKSEFLSSMSHELRTPLNAILGFAQLLVAGRRMPLTERQKHHVEQIQKSGQHLLSLINEVLDLAKIEAGHLHLSIETLYADGIIREVVENLATSAQAAEVRLALPDSCHLAIRADYTRVKQVLINLLSNAIKYNRRSGRVSIHCERSESMLRITVSDTGQGIPEARLAELFEPFNRLDAENSAIEGTGIGLTLTKELIERMGGRIGVNSQIDIGSDFWFELPLATELSASHAITDNGNVERPASNPVHYRILYIEDNPANLRLMEAIFDEHEHLTLKAVPNAVIGLDLAKSAPPDLILMDIDLPGIDGYQALTRLKEEERTRDIPVIAVSANAMKSDLDRARKAGFAAYLTKPIDIVQLLDEVTRRLPAGRSRISSGQ